jgi:hypothetical protein
VICVHARGTRQNKQTNRDDCQHLQYSLVGRAEQPARENHRPAFFCINPLADVDVVDRLWLLQL